MRQVLRRCFSEAEWEWLRWHAQFAHSLHQLHTLADVERLVFLGQDLLREAVHHGATELRPLPPGRSPMEAASPRAGVLLDP